MPSGCNLSESITICTSQNTEAVKRAKANYISCFQGTVFNIAPLWANTTPNFSHVFRVFPSINPFSAKPQKWLNTTQTIRRQFVDKLFECV